MKEVAISDVFDADKKDTRENQTVTTTADNYPLIFAEEIRQFLYCKRIVYWRRVADIDGSPTYLMKAGTAYHKKRSNARYQRQDDLVTYRNRIFIHTELGFGAKLDVLRERDDEIIPVEYKRFKHGNTDRMGHIIQVVVGGLAAEFELQKVMSRIEIQYYPGKQSIIEIGTETKKKTRNLIQEIQSLVSTQVLPSPTKDRGKCRNCEYKKICFGV